MVEVVHQTTSEVIRSPFEIFSYLGQNWGLILVSIICIILTFLLIYRFNSREDERHERDDPVYQGFRNLKRDCILGRNDKKIRKTYSLMNLLWLGFPLKKNEHSNVIVDYRDKLLGYYRGESFSQDGYFNILAYKRKFLLFFETVFLIRCPLSIDRKYYERDKVTKKYIHDEKGKVREKIRKIDLKKFIGELSNGDIKIRCTGLEKLSYFNYPVYVDSLNDILDFRKDIQDDVVDLGYNQMLSRVLTTGSSMVEKAMLHNPNVKYNQLSPEKTKAEVQQDTQ